MRNAEGVMRNVFSLDLTGLKATKKRKAAIRLPCNFQVERAMGVEPTSKAWEALVLPMNYAREI